MSSAYETMLAHRYGSVPGSVKDAASHLLMSLSDKDMSVSGPVQISGDEYRIRVTGRGVSDGAILKGDMAQLLRWYNVTARASTVPGTAGNTMDIHITSQVG